MATIPPPTGSGRNANGETGGLEVPPIPIVTAPGSHQSELSGIEDWDPAHLGSWLQDHDRDGVFTLTTFDIPPGDYEAKIAHDRSWVENYGAGGAAGGQNIAFTVPAKSRTTFSYELQTHLLTIRTAPAPTTRDLAALRAQWLRRDLLVLDLQGSTAAVGWEYRLQYARRGGIEVDRGVLTGASSIPLSVDVDRLPADVRSRWPHTGLFTDPNGSPAGPPVAQRDSLLSAQDQIKIGLTGNLRDFQFVDRFGDTVPGSQVWRGGAPTGYTAEPSEVVSYVDAHDNETLFDALTIKLPSSTSMADRVRMNTLCLATVALGQGPVLWHAGTDLLRSKSLDRNSFNSGDWFNRIDWTGRTTTFGSGLPPAADNQPKWPIYRPLLANPMLAPGPEDIAAARAAALDLLRIRFSSKLFRLGSAAKIKRQVSFPDGGPDQAAEVLVMVLVGVGERIVVVFNASPWWQTVQDADAAALALHPVQRVGLDPIVRLTSIATDSMTVPPRTVAVLRSGGAISPTV